MDSIEQGIELANEIAPEHLELAIERPFEHLGRVRNAGSIFLGRMHRNLWGITWRDPTTSCLPVERQVFSPLSVDDFIKKSA